MWLKEIIYLTYTAFLTFFNYKSPLL